MKFIILALILLSIAVESIAAPSLPKGDTQGNVLAVMVRNTNTNNGVAQFQIWFSPTTKDRWECISSNGYVTVKENGVGVNSESFQMIYSAALAAQTIGKELAVDSSATKPCENVNSAWIIN